MTALTLAQSDQKRGSDEARATLENLDSKKLEQLRADFEHDYHVPLDVALSKSDLNDTAKESIPTLLHGVDKINAEDISHLAHIALTNGDKRAFCEALRGDSPEAAAARDKLLQEPGFQRQVQETFNNPGGMTGVFGTEYPQGKDWTAAVDPVVSDYIKDGGISLKTVIQNNTSVWPLDNKENVR